MTNKIYPDIEFKTTTLENEVHIQALTWVPVKRESGHYKVLYTDNVKVPKRDEYAGEVCRFTSRVHDGALRVRYLWAAPQEGVPVLNPDGVKKDIMELTDKERFLLNFRQI